MGADLYNLDALLHSLAPAMLGIPPGGGPWAASKFPAGSPVVELVGDRATGKTAALSALYDGFHTFVPTARVDLSDAPYSAADPVDRERLDTINGSPVTNLLFTIAYELGRRPESSGRPVTFPRLAPALLVIAAWRPEPAPAAERPGPVAPPELAEAERELRRLLAQQDPSPKVRRATFNRWLQALTGVIAGLLPGVPGIEGVLRAGADTLLERKAGDPQWTWWRTRLHHRNGDAVQRLFDLVRSFRNRGPDRLGVESDLIAALLADIDAAYGLWGRASRHPPLILLDNLDDALQTRLLTPLLTQYAQVGGRRATRPVLVATSLGDGSARSLTPVTDRAPWRAPDRCPPTSWLLRLGIPRVGDDEVRAMLGDADYSPTPALPHLLVRLSGGRTGNALLLAETAATRLRAASSLAPGRLLSMPSPDGKPGTVADRLLEQLVPDAGVRAQLTDLAPALDEGAAAELLRSLRSDGPEGSPTLRVRRLMDGTLSLDHWNHDPWPTAYGPMPLIADRALRALLLHRLRERGGREHWDRLHRRLASQYRPGPELPADSVRHDPRYLHHALAQGRLDDLVVRAMHHRYLRNAPADWLRDLNIVAAAPEAFEGFAPERAPADAPPCPACATSDARVHNAIRRLLATLWRLSSPAAEPPSGYRHHDIERVRRALEALCEDYDVRHRHGGPHNAYVDACAQGGWIDALLERAQAPDLPVWKGDDR